MITAASRRPAHRTEVTIRATSLEYAAGIIHAVCRLAGTPSLVDDFQTNGIVEAIGRHDTATLFDWLAAALSFQGISDRIADGYMARHGQATWDDIARNLTRAPPCPKLKSYWHFHDCRYHKGSGTCAEPEHFADCPLPVHDLRNGRLNQTAYSLFLFIRDIANGDLVGWIDGQLAEADAPNAPDRLARLRQALLSPLGQVFGVSDKVLSMTLSSLLLGAGPGRPRWAEVGGSMIVVDTLVHNFLHRTGILDRLNAGHQYGPVCYQRSGCAGVLEVVAQYIDARTFNPDFPATFPRFVQYAVWRYCAQLGLNVCNGNRIDDRYSCKNVYCRIYDQCDRVSLRAPAVGVT
jgi:hypothetical protein